MLAWGKKPVPVLWTQCRVGARWVSGNTGDESPTRGKYGVTGHTGQGTDSNPRGKQPDGRDIFPELRNNLAESSWTYYARWRGWDGWVGREGCLFYVEQAGQAKDLSKRLGMGGSLGAGSQAYERGKRWNWNMRPKGKYGGEALSLEAVRVLIGWQFWLQCRQWIRGGNLQSMGLTRLL